jgi:hypothetical protein
MASKTEYLLIAAFIASMLAFPLLAGAQTSNSTNPNTNVEAAVRAYFADIPVMIKVAKCESEYRQFNSSGSALHGGTGDAMVGVFQIYKTVHEKFASSLGMDIHTLEGNLAYARYIYDREGTVPWNSSAPCWEENTPDLTKISSSQDSPLTKTVPAVLISSELSVNLKIGMSHRQVLTLQQILNKNGFIVAYTGGGAPGSETTFFGTLTRAAVRKFQCEKQIVCSGDERTTGFGQVGPKTRAALLELI